MVKILHCSLSILLKFRFDPWLLLEALRKKAHNLGANFITGEVVDFSTLDTGDKGTGAFLRVESAIVSLNLQNLQMPSQTCIFIYKKLNFYR